MTDLPALLSLRDRLREALCNLRLLVTEAAEHGGEIASDWHAYVREADTALATAPAKETT